MLRNTYDHANLICRVIKSIYGISPHRTRDGCGGWANMNCLRSSPCLLRLIHCECMEGKSKEGLKKTQRFYRLFVPRMIRGVFDVSWMIILKSETELRRVEFLLLSVFVVQERAQQMNMGMWRMKAQIHVLRNSGGSTWIPPDGVHYGR